MEELGGAVEIASRPGGGTRVIARIPWDHPDRPPLGDLADTLVPIILTSPGVAFQIVLEGNGNRVELTTEGLNDPSPTAEALGRLQQAITEAVDAVGLKEGA